MEFDGKVLSGGEKLSYSLLSLYGKYGYGQYRMSKFEEYSLYGKNIDFLVSDSVITFTESNGRLMALKPDVTLSIVKNTRGDPSGVKRVCYSENVYRVPKGGDSFKEIKQVGLECLGDVDACLTGEVLTLAEKSLALTGREYALSVSHLGLLSLSFDRVTKDAAVKNRLMKCAGEKNVHGIKEICAFCNAGEDAVNAALGLVSVYGAPDKVFPVFGSLPLDEEQKRMLDELKNVLSVFQGTEAEKRVTVDFSVTADENYYDGVVFRGFVEGVPESVLSGGSYGKLMKKMGKNSRAVGFAVYVDSLKRLYAEREEYDFDVMLVYNDETPPSELQKETEKIISSGRSVFCCKRKDGGVRCRETAVL